MTSSTSADAQAPTAAPRAESASIRRRTSVSSGAPKVTASASPSRAPANRRHRSSEGMVSASPMISTPSRARMGARRIRLRGRAAACAMG